MASFKILKTRFQSILFWSVISAAFIGPGTVTTCTKSGADFQFDLMWVMLFSTITCLMLQEATARLTIFSRMTLGKAIAVQFEGRSSKIFIFILIIGAIIVGCAAYEAGNILGSIEGLRLVYDKIPKQYYAIGTGVLALMALYLKSVHTVAKIMGSFVFIMCIAFLTTAFSLDPPIKELFKGIFIPKIPDVSGAGLLILGLIGTTVVPYDIFLGSSVADKKQTLADMRFGLAVAIILGGMISMAIMVVGTAITEGLNAQAASQLVFSFELLGDILVLYIGEWSVLIFGFGLFAAGFTSAITAPLASALTASSLFSKDEDDRWRKNSLRFRLIYVMVLAVGLTFGLMNVKPIPVIIIAQALNGLILPFVGIFLIYAVNDIRIMTKAHVNSLASNILMSAVVWITMIIGLMNILKALSKVIEIQFLQSDYLFSLISLITFLIAVFVFVGIYKRKKKQLTELEKNIQN